MDYSTESITQLANQMTAAFKVAVAQHLETGGKALTIAGLNYLRSRSLPMAMLYVDANNAPALHLYESLGFAPWDTDVMYRL